MGHRFAIVLVVGIIGATIVIDVIMYFMFEQFGLWFAIPMLLLVLGSIYLAGYHSSEQWRKEAGS